MAVLLNDMLKLSKDPLEKGFITDLLRASDLMKIVPFDDVGGLQVTGTRWQTIPGVGFRKLNAGYAESTGNTEEISETMVQLGGDVKIDRVYTKVQNTKQDPLSLQMKMKAQSIAFQFNNSYINGDQAVNPDEFEGVKKRNANMPSRMTVNLYNTTDANDGMIVLKDATHARKFLDAMHEATKYVDGATHILLNEKSWLGFGKLYRLLGLLETTTEAYGKVWESFRGLPLVDVGLLSDKSTEIITNTEDPGDGGNDASSIYIVRIDTDDGLHGIQLSGTSPKPYDPLNGGEMESGPQYLRRIDWTVGLFNLSQYCICRVKGFRFAEA